MVFTCVTDTDQLAWIHDNGTLLFYYSPNQINQSAVTKGIFVPKLVHTNDTRTESTATVYNVSLNDDGQNITCTSSVSDASADSDTGSIDIGI